MVPAYLSSFNPCVADAGLLGCEPNSSAQRSHGHAETSQTTGGIAFWAHVGGFVVGILLIKLFPQRRGRYRYGTW